MMRAPRFLVKCVIGRGADDRGYPMTGIEFIAAERERQVSEEGWTPEHDDTHGRGELALAAACYAVPLPDRLAAGWSWPFEPESFKPAAVDAPPEKKVRDLVKAGALIAAEIDRLQRALRFQAEMKQMCHNLVDR